MAKKIDEASLSRALLADLEVRIRHWSHHQARLLGRKPLLKLEFEGLSPPFEAAVSANPLGQERCETDSE